jgi:ubiquinone/menaquinone biosynthesis C-methylase UbiE
MSDRPFESHDIVLAWERRARVRAILMAEATQRMLAAARIGLGSRVLDVGTGTGETALLAAERAAPIGKVIAIDASPAMIEQARAHVREAGVANVDLRVMDGAQLEVEEASVDAVIGRNAMMLLPEWPAPLAGFHRVLRPGGRLSFIVWAPKEENPFFYLPVALARKHGWMRVPIASLEGPFQLADARSLRRDLEAAGFRASAVERVASETRMMNAAALVAYLREGPMYLNNADQLSQADRAAFDEALVAAIERFRDGDGYRIATVSLLTTGTR